MYRSLILVSKKPVVVQIFTLVCKKLNILLTVLNEAQVDSKADIIVMDTEFIDDRFNIVKGYSKLIGAISKKELPFEIANDFLVPLPFLPSVLQDILEEQLVVLDKKEKSKTYMTAVDTPQEEVTQEAPSDDSEPALDYLESLADDIAVDMDEENDDSIVSVASINNGGVLDSNELSQIEELIDPSGIENEVKTFADIDENENEDKWLDLSSIIDQAISEVNTVGDIYNKYDNHPINVLLNNYELDQLTPLLNLLDQNIIDSLTQGQEITLQLKFENTNE
jgi:hypothetical protein